MEYLDSKPEKYEYAEKHGIVEHWMFVHELQTLLEQLQPNDWLTPNEIHNLMIGRDNIEGVGMINFATNEVEIWNKI
jgi:hypothetical protein